MNYGNCDITIKTEDGKCMTFVASCANVCMEQEFAEVTDCCGKISKVSVGKAIKLEAKLCDRSSDICPPKKPGLLKRIFRKIV